MQATGLCWQRNIRSRHGILTASPAKNCESGDVLIDTIKLPEAKSGDLLAVYSTGAYWIFHGKNYNRLGRPAVIFAGHGKARVCDSEEERLMRISMIWKYE